MISAATNILTHRSHQEKLARHVEDLVAEVYKERETRRRAESDVNRADKEHDSELRRERRSMEAKESALQSALNDLAAVQFSLQGVESESKRLGETHTAARFSLQLEGEIGR
jgi:response regulator RpfG family c-di-GMP phosphodiesterase